ncbi:MAG: thioredoxin [Clostridiales bacterium]|nr:MAG: thioredoxin [Clostridiales bacterium]
MAELKITKNNFEAEVVRSELPVLLDFWAPWCAPCRMLSPVVEQIAGEYEGKAKVGKVNVDEEQELAAAFGVSSIPMVVVVKAGKVQAASVGFQPKAQLAAMLEKEI